MTVSAGENYYQTYDIYRRVERAPFATRLHVASVL